MNPKPISIPVTAAAVLAAGLGVLSISCGSRQAPEMPIYASPIDLTLLAGEWKGEYSSHEGRRGYIGFRLEPGEDTARGEVVIYPEVVSRRTGDGGDPYADRAMERQPDPTYVPVEFVWTERGQVQGMLKPYRDPELGTTLATGFRGQWRGELIEGDFESRDGGRVVRTGWWRVVRTGGKVEGAPLRVGDELPPYADLVELGREVFVARGCTACHGEEGDEANRTAEAGAPRLEAVTEHRTFPWVYHMVVSPDSMLQADATARSLVAGYTRRMPDRDVTPWEALLLYEYLVERAAARPATN